MNILITGGCGYIGSFCARALIKLGYSVTVLDNFCNSSPDYSLNVVSGDVRDLNRLKIVLKHAHVIVHFAALASVPDSISDPENYWKTNYTGTENVLLAMRANNVPRILFSSTAAVYGEHVSKLDEDAITNPSTPYGRSKLAAEYLINDYAKAYGLNATIFRFLCVCGAEASGLYGEQRKSETHLMACALKAAKNKSKVSVYGNSFSTPDGTGIRDYIHVEDVVKAHVAALELNKQGTYVLGTGKGYSVLEVLNACDRITKKRVRREIKPARPGDPASLVSVPIIAMKALNWKPTLSLEDCIASTWKWINKHA